MPQLLPRGMNVFSGPHPPASDWPGAGESAGAAQTEGQEVGGRLGAAALGAGHAREEAPEPVDHPALHLAPLLTKWERSEWLLPVMRFFNVR